MKRIALLAAAAGSLAAMTAPAQAAELPAAGMTVNTITLTPTAAMAGDPPRHARAYGRRAKDRERYYDRRDRRDRYDRYDRYEQQRYRERRLSRNDRIWRGRDGNYYCNRGDGTTGLVIGAGLGALAGRAVDTRGDRTLGTILGAVAGGLLGREIDRGELRCR